MLQQLPPPDSRLGARCLACDGRLVFVHSSIAGVFPVEAWDRYVCAQCGLAFDLLDLEQPSDPPRPSIVQQRRRPQ